MKALILYLLTRVLNCLSPAVHCRKYGLGLPHVQALIFVAVGVYLLGQVALGDFPHAASPATGSRVIRAGLGLALLIVGGLIYYAVRIPGTPDEWFAWLAGSDQIRRHKAKLILGGFSPGDRVPLAPLIARLSNSEEEPVFWAAIALGRLGAQSISALPALIQLATTHPACGVRQAAINALVKIAPGSKTVKATLHQALEDHDPFVRSDALQGFIYMENIEESDLEAIRALEQDPNDSVRNGSEITLRNIGLRPPSGKPRRRP